MKRVISLAIALTLLIFGDSREVYRKSSRIINGNDGTVGQFPYMISLRQRVDNQHFCGAAILSSRFLLTAAHCCMDENALPANVYAVAGALRQSSGGTIIDLDRITRHNGWNMTQAIHDISILRTTKDIIFTQQIQPIALPTSNLPADGHTPTVYSGWGGYKFPSMETPDVLQFIELETISVTDCQNRYKNISGDRNLIYMSVVCTVAKNNGGLCYKDSGSPLVDMTDPNHRTLAGIGSWGIICAQGYPDISTRVYSYLDWIRKQIEEQSN